MARYNRTEVERETEAEVPLPRSSPAIRRKEMRRSQRLFPAPEVPSRLQASLSRNQSRDHRRALSKAVLPGPAEEVAVGIEEDGQVAEKEVPAEEPEEEEKTPGEKQASG